MEHRDVIAVGASAGGLQALAELVKDLPADLPAAILVTVHLRADANELVLSRFVGRAGRLPAIVAREGDTLTRGRIHIAPPDRHLLVDGDRLLVRRGPLENRARPAIDPMFRSVACSFGGRAVGVVLTGLLDDGAAGLLAIKSCGGLAVVQDPADAEYPDMPRSAIEHAAPHHVAPLSRLPGLLVELIGTPAGVTVAPSPDLLLEVRIAAELKTGFDPQERAGQPAPFSCPTCHTGLWEIPENDDLRYRSQPAHAHAPTTLAHAQMDDVERALSSALRALEDRIRLLRRLRRKMTTARAQSGEWLDRPIGESQEQASLIRALLLRGRQQSGPADLPDND